MDEHSHAGKKPQIAVVNRNTLAANGLTSLIEGVMPMAEVAVFNNMSDIPESLLSGFFHFFISADVLFENREYFVGQCHKTIVVTEGDRHPTIPACFRTLDATLNSHALLREFLRMEQMAHGGGRKLPEEMKQSGNMTAKSPELTPREIEVLHEIVTGHINKEIADKLNISLTTVITHRKNIMEKLHAKSVATLAIYAVMHGIVPVDQI
ncbi:MAG: response regulator transcription factor [Prevotellaceae bacterium]|nr:response regulator transcription factor [Bacteroidaceae bacterium]MCI6518428.1 response regulator transcription factor [Prevotellaceae bacterium]MDD7375770.1 response regulator transcription factor [Prevotellaceae bacterium]